MSANKRNLALLLDRPLEPVFYEKGKNNALFEVPNQLLTDRYKNNADIQVRVQDRLGEESTVRVPVRANIAIPNLSVPMQLDRKAPFSLLIPYHRKLATHLISVFIGLRSVDDLQTVAVYARDRLNPLLFNYALSVALLHRPDTKNVDMPLLFEVFPDKFIDSKVIGRAREEATVVTEDLRQPITIPKDYTASDLEPEHRLWYFREDIGLNIHHWHWHLVFPSDGPDQIVRKDRRGELFYYMHQQIQARYNFERFSNDLPRVQRLNNFRDPIPEAYFPKMDSLVSSRAWPSRSPNMKMSDLNRDLEQLRFDIADLERWDARFVQACHQGFVQDPRGNQIQLDEATGIDILGNLLESSTLSVNRDFYGDLHNMLHVALGLIHDPDSRHLETFATIGDPAVDLRDPVFYRLHAYVDDLFQEHKQRLTPYTTQQLNFQGIQLNSVQVQPNRGAANTFQTFWQQTDIDLSRGLDFVPRGNVFARFTHLQNADFTYNININNSTGAPAMGTVRIFLAPQNDERGTRMFLRDQRLLMCELDKFTVALQPGDNAIRRTSTESSVTVAFERTFRDLDTNRPAAGTQEEQDFIFCGCGWPQHMLIPKGKSGVGLPCDLFVMVSNYQDDRVDQDLVGICNEAPVFCGLRDRLYPDRKAMGYPFDRLPRQGVDQLSQFLTPNMTSVPVSIIHTDSVQAIRKGR
ncbi:phenoloxidase 2-like [Contarinia nasturtii]|uniref:phenoloxidase 2-like n=1 Tax=Contarinia nasturtii TaxID=265458 RepID=UPI0012D43F9D|nr:phenoloxidase 2-like [Contarinia nasturtii]